MEKVAHELKLHQTLKWNYYNTSCINTTMEQLHYIYDQLE